MIAPTRTPSGNVAADTTLEPGRRGKRAIKRAALAPGSRGVEGPSGNVAINEVNLRAAVVLGN